MVQGILNKSIVSIYKEPDVCSEMVDEGLYGSIVTVLEEKVLWARIRTHYGYEGYVQREGILFCINGIEQWQQADKRVVYQTCGDVLLSPKVQGVCYISLARGAILKVLGLPDANGWVSIQLWDGCMGYIKESYLGGYIPPELVVTRSEEFMRHYLTKTANQYLGTQYRWGGRSSLGIDCSGLCSISYLLNGIIIYRDAKIVDGFPVKEIAKKDKKLGDLLYFPGHIAMYLGEECYIHSTALRGSDGVVINSLNPKDNRYRKDLAESMYAVGSVFC